MTPGHAITFTVPIRTVSPLNVREHWRVRHARVQREGLATILALPRRSLTEHGVAIPVVVQMTRIAPKRNRIKDSDALPGSLKAIRDQVALTLGVDDADLLLEKPPIIWAPPRQEVGPWGVRVEIASIPSTSAGVAPLAPGSCARCGHTSIAHRDQSADCRVVGCGCMMFQAASFMEAMGITWTDVVKLVWAARRWQSNEVKAALAPFAPLVTEDVKP